MPNTPESITKCPNCGYEAQYNYCAQCGQQTHLHKDTIVGLAEHFMEHFLNFDSKFFQTIKALLFSPGKLTIAYWNKQRVKYIPPVSLYLFISAIFFLLPFIMPSVYHSMGYKSEINHHVNSVSSSFDKNIASDSTAISDLDQKVNVASAKFRDADSSERKEIKEWLFHSLPKVFFFLIPLMGLLLTILFIKRKDISFVDHTIFSLHYHSFSFLVMSLYLIYLFHFARHYLLLIIFICLLIYFFFALKNAYKIKWP